MEHPATYHHSSMQADLPSSEALASQVLSLSLKLLCTHSLSRTSGSLITFPSTTSLQHLDFLCVLWVTELVSATKCKNSIPPLDLLPLCLSTTKSYSPPHSQPQPHRMDPPCNAQPDSFQAEQAALLCAHSKLKVSSLHLVSLFGVHRGKKTLVHQ